MDPGSVLAMQFRVDWREYRRWRKKFLKRGSAKSVHQLRTSIRRFSGHLRLTKDLVHGPAYRRLRDCLRRDLSALGRLRDLQVQRKQPPALLPAGVDREKYARFLEKEERREWRRARKDLGERDLGFAKKSVERILSDVAALGARDLRAIARGFEGSQTKVKRLEGELVPGRHRRYHRLRLQVKRLAYQTEIARELALPRLPSRGRLERLKTRLGNLQDHRVAFALAEPFLVRSRRHPHPRREFERRLRREERALSFASGAAGNL